MEIKEFKIDGVIVDRNDKYDEDTLLDEFIEWIESKGLEYGGGFEDITNKAEEVIPLDEYMQENVIDTCEDIDEVMDELTGWGLDWYTTYTFTFKGDKYSFELVDSGKSDDPGVNYPEIENFKKIEV
jgi:hypothetical protein